MKRRAFISHRQTQTWRQSRAFPPSCRPRRITRADVVFTLSIFGAIALILFIRLA